MALGPKTRQLLDMMDGFTLRQYAFVAGYCAEKSPAEVEDALAALLRFELMAGDGKP